MIQRELKTVTVRTFTTGIDAYGQVRQEGSTERTVEMAIEEYSRTNTDDIRYESAEFVGLTKDTSITNANQIEYDGTVYEVLYVRPSKRLSQVVLRRA